MPSTKCLCQILVIIKQLRIFAIFKLTDAICIVDICREESSDEEACVPESLSYNKPRTLDGKRSHM